MHSQLALTEYALLNLAPLILLHPVYVSIKCIIASDDVVCNTFFETECNTTDIVPEPGYEPTPVTYCDKVGFYSVQFTEKLLTQIKTYLY